MSREDENKNLLAIVITIITLAGYKSRHLYITRVITEFYIIYNIICVGKPTLVRTTRTLFPR
jgi:hypothetical protein